jgi:hypothetical protein
VHSERRLWRTTPSGLGKKCFRDILTLRMIFVVRKGLKAVSKCILLGSCSVKLQVDVEYTSIESSTPKVHRAQETRNEIKKPRHAAYHQFSRARCLLNKSPASPASINIMTTDPARGTPSSQFSSASTQHASRSPRHALTLARNDFRIIFQAWIYCI